MTNLVFLLTTQSVFRLYWENLIIIEIEGKVRTGKVKLYLELIVPVWFCTSMLIQMLRLTEHFTPISNGAFSKNNAFEKFNDQTC